MCKLTPEPSGTCRPTRLTPYAAWLVVTLVAQATEVGTVYTLTIGGPG